MPTRENQYACHDLSVWNIFNKRPKFTFAQSKRFSPNHNLPDKENNSLEQVAFWHEGKVVCCLPIPLFYTGEITMTVGPCTELEELFASTNIWQIRLLVGHMQTPFPLSSNSKASLCSDLKKKKIPILARANPGNQHSSFYSESFGIYSSRYGISRMTCWKHYLTACWQLASKCNQRELPVAGRSG